MNLTRTNGSLTRFHFPKQRKQERVDFSLVIKSTFRIKVFFFFSKNRMNYNNKIFLIHRIVYGKALKGFSYVQKRHMLNHNYHEVIQVMLVVVVKPMTQGEKTLPKTFLVTQILSILSFRSMTLSGFHIITCDQMISTFFFIELSKEKTQRTFSTTIFFLGFLCFSLW